MHPKAPFSTHGLSYRDAGVDIDSGNALVERIRRHHPAFQSLQMGWM